MRDFAESFYSSAAWKNTRASYMQSVGGLCERCKANGRLSPAEIVHHKIHISPDNVDDPNITLNWNNLQALCRECHGDVHKRVKKRYKVEKDGRIVANADP